MAEIGRLAPFCSLNFAVVLANHPLLKVTNHEFTF